MPSFWSGTLSFLGTTKRGHFIMNTNLIYCRYSRKSSEAKERQALSIQDQNIECDRYAERERIRIRYKFEESQTSFKPDKRPIFKKMIDLIKTGNINAILTWKEDRLCRNPKEGGEILQLLQDGIIKEIRTVNGSIYTQDSDHLILQIHFGMANQYSRNLSQNVRRGLNHKVERGEYPRPAIIGYESYGERGQRNIKPHPSEASFIRQTFELAATNFHSIYQISRIMTEKGMRSKTNKKLSKSHFHKILNTPTYYGYFYHNGELYKGNYEPIISKSLYDKVQDALHNRSKPKKHDWLHPYNGLLKCSECGCAITTSVKIKFYKGTNRKAQYTYHHCTRRRGNCHQPPITDQDLENLFIENVEKINIDKNIWNLGMELLKVKHKEEGNKNINQLNTLHFQYDKLQEKLNHLITMRANEELTKEEFSYQKNLLIEEQLRIKNMMTDSENSSHNWLELAEKFLETCFDARDIMLNGDYEEKRKLILTVGENLLLKNRQIVFTFQKPFDVLLRPAVRTNVLRG